MKKLEIIKDNNEVVKEVRGKGINDWNGNVIRTVETL